MTEKNKKPMPDLANMTREEEARFWDDNSPLDFMEPDELQVMKGPINPKITQVERVNRDDYIGFRATSTDVEELKHIADQKGLDLSTLMRLISRYYLKNKDDISLA